MRLGHLLNLPRHHNPATHWARGRRRKAIRDVLLHPVASGPLTTSSSTAWRDSGVAVRENLYGPNRSKINQKGRPAAPIGGRSTTSGAVICAPKGRKIRLLKTTTTLGTGPDLARHEVDWEKVWNDPFSKTRMVPSPKSAKRPVAAAMVARRPSGSVRLPLKYKRPRLGRWISSLQLQ